MSMINEELPTKKIKQLEGKFAVVERSSKRGENGKDLKPKTVFLESSTISSKKNIGNGVSIMFANSTVKNTIPIVKSATDFLSARSSLSADRRQPISRIIGRKWSKINLLMMSERERSLIVRASAAVSFSNSCTCSVSSVSTYHPPAAEKACRHVSRQTGDNECSVEYIVAFNKGSSGRRLLPSDFIRMLSVRKAACLQWQWLRQW